VSHTTEEVEQVKLAAAAVMLAVPALAQAPSALPTPPPARLEAMRKLAFLEGTWKGEGSMQMGPQRRPFRGTEIVTRKLDGLALLVEGLHHAGPPGAEKVVHQTLAVLSAEDDGTYAFHTWLANGRGGIHKGEWKDGAFVWTLENPVQGKVRFTIRLDAQGRWAEIGEASRDGVTWTPFFDMTLTKVP
jgi:hypothetical protein